MRGHRGVRQDVDLAVVRMPLEGVGATLGSDEHVLTVVALGEHLDRLEKALDTLPETYREIVLLRRLEELRYAEIAERLGKSPDACRMLFARARAALTVKMRGTP